MSFIPDASAGSSSDYPQEMRRSGSSSPSEGLQGRRVKKKQAAKNSDEAMAGASSQALKRKREEEFRSDALAAKKATPVRSPGQKMFDHVGRTLAGFVPKESISSLSLVSKHAHRVLQENPSKEVAIEKVAKRPDSFNVLGAYLKKDHEVLASLISVQPDKFFSLSSKDQMNQNIIGAFVETHIMNSGLDDQFENEEIDQSEYLNRCADLFNGLSAKVQKQSTLGPVEKDLLLFALKRELYVSAFSTIKDDLSIDNVMMVTYPEIEDSDPESLSEDLESIDNIYDFIEHVPNDLRADKSFMQRLIGVEPGIVSALLVEAGSQKTNPLFAEDRTPSKIIELIADKNVLLDLVENDVRYAGVLGGAHVQKLLADKSNIPEFVKIEGAAKYLPVLMKDSADIIKEAVSVSSHNLEFASDRLKGDPQFIKSLIASKPDSLKYASNALKGDRQFIKELVAISPESLEYADNALKNDKAFIKELVSISPKSLGYASQSLRDSEEFIQELMTFPSERREDKQFMKNLIAGAPIALKFLPDTLRDDKEFMRELVLMPPQKRARLINITHSVANLEAASVRLKNDAQFIKELISSVSDCQTSLLVLVFCMSETLRDNQEVMSEFVRVMPSLIRAASDRIRDDEKIMKELESIAGQPLSDFPRMTQEMTL